MTQELRDIYNRLQIVKRQIELESLKAESKTLWDRYAASVTKEDLERELQEAEKQLTAIRAGEIEPPAPTGPPLAQFMEQLPSLVRMMVQGELAKINADNDRSEPEGLYS